MSRRHRSVVCAGALLIVGILLLGYDRYMQERNRELSIIYIPKVEDEDNQFWSTLLAGARLAADEKNIRLTIAAPKSEQDYDGQNALILWAIEQQPDAILLSPCDYEENLAAARLVGESKIPLVLVDSGVKEELGDCMVATDNFIAGVRMGELAKEKMTADTQIAIVSHIKNSTTAMERMEGIRYALGDQGGQIAEIVYCDSDYGRAEELTEEILAAHPGIGLIIGTNEYAAVGAARAVKRMGKGEEITMIGFDNSVEQVQFLEEGILDGIVIQKSFNMGYLAVEQAAAIARGEPYQAHIDSGSVAVTRENMQKPENQKLLFPFIQKQYQQEGRKSSGE